MSKNITKLRRNPALPRYTYEKSITVYGVSHPVSAIVKWAAEDGVGTPMLLCWNGTDESWKDLVAIMCREFLG